MANGTEFFDTTSHMDHISVSERNFQILSNTDIVNLFSARQLSCAEKQIIYNQGTRADSVYVLTSGMVKLISHLSNGKARIVRVHSASAWLGLCGIMQQPYRHTAVAVDNIKLYRIPTSEIIQLKADNLRLYCQLLEHWFNYLQAADLWISEFSTGTIKTRVARLVNFLSDIENRSAANEVKLLTCEEMANVLGATPESVSRVLAEFKRDKILSRRIAAKTRTHDIYHCDEPALDAIANS